MALSEMQVYVMERIDAGKSNIRWGYFGPEIETDSNHSVYVSGIAAATVDDLVQRGLLHIEPGGKYNPTRATRLTAEGRAELIDAGGYAG